MNYALPAATTLLMLQAALHASYGAQPSTEPPPLSGASVTIPYAELQSLWFSAHPPVPVPEIVQPPVSYLLSEAAAELKIGEQASTLEVKFQVETFGRAWVTVPLISGEARLEKAAAGTAGTVIWQDGYAYLAHQAGKAQVTLQLTLPGWKAAVGGQAIAFKLGPAAIKQLRVTGVPAQFSARLNGQALATGADALSLSGGTDQISLALAAPEPERKVVPSAWRAEAQVLAQQQEGRLQLRSKLFAHAESGSGLSLDFRLPAKASQVAVSGEDLASWSQTRPDDRQRIVHVQFKTWDVLDRELAITFSIPVSPLAERWAIPAPISTDDQDPHVLYVIALADGLELKAPQLKTGLETQRPPGWMREEIPGASIVTAEAGGELLVQPHWLSAVATSEATITSARSELRLVADGSFQTTASYSIKHAAALAWPIELPAGVELLSCNLDQRAAHPLRRENGTLELMLPGRAGEASSTEVTFVYTGKRSALDAISGKLSLELARTPLFIDRLEWSIAIPETFEITAVEGNAQIASKSTGDSDHPNQIALRKDLCRDEQPSVELYYQHRGLDQ